MPISALRFTNLGPFDEVEFEFDPQVNVLVGPNNCGKSTVLLALADISVDPFSLPLKLIR
ncbi:MAG: AAA family ATPase, partial [Planctomycetes bacterium]|nr:AAA family ATPase [Planctomycetota bacterium]